MKKVSNRATIALFLTIALVAGLCIYCVSFVYDGASWAMYPTNKHIYKNGGLKMAGRILDRSGTVLAKTENGYRIYNNDSGIRRATLHAVGDPEGNIATSAQRNFADRLCGYNILNGIYSFNGLGNDLYLTIDASVCSTALKALNGRKGAVGVYNYQTGEIICMVSSPTFDPQNPPDISESTGEDYGGVYINRFLSASFVPGSVFKLVTTAAAIDNIKDIDTRKFDCEKTLDIVDDTITCPNAHGKIDFKTALAVSCNTAFAKIGIELGPQVLTRYADNAGLNGDGLTIDGIKTASSKFNVSNAEKADLAWAGIGQYTDLVNPLSLMVYMGAIANGGVPASPELISRVTTNKGFPKSVYIKKNLDRMLSENTAEKLSEMMHYNVEANYKTANFPGLDICAKSGTAEVGGGKTPNAWFTGFIRNKDYPLAFVVLVENGGAGSKVAGPVANTVLQASVKALKKK